MRRVPQSYRNGELVIVIDCGDLDRSARFWCGVLGYTAVPSPSVRYRSLVPDGGPGAPVLVAVLATAAIAATAAWVGVSGPSGRRLSAVFRGGHRRR